MNETQAARSCKSLRSSSKMDMRCVLWTCEFIGLPNGLLDGSAREGKSEDNKAKKLGATES